ncbi:hypothetical protein TYRP_015357 [Tyrophagus putrescentiae]|nr:hypothetical protein TYRP_015357 [Tyrophagus putrescentiae]
MLNKTFLLLLIALIACLSSQQTNGAKFHNRQLFVSKFAKRAAKGHNFLAILKTAQTSIRDQALQGLKSLPSTIKTELLKEADHQLKSAAYPRLTATLFMGYFRTGSRDPYSSLYDEHLRRVATLTVGHLLEKESSSGSVHHQHKYLDEIVNGLWSLMEQSTWCMPHHLVHQGTSDHLPLPDRQAIDLNAGEVAKLVAWVRLLLHEDLDRVVSKVVVKRIDAELRRRIFDPYMSRRGFSWEGFANHFVNNWNIWCNGNVLKAAVYTLRGDEPYFTSVLNRSLYSADFFLDDYGEDGGCEEGPAYWREAGGRLLDYLDSLERLFPSEAETYFSEQKLLKAIGEYAYKMRITGNWFVNFADSVPVLTYPPELLLKYGDLFKDEGQQNSGGKSHFVAMLGSGDLNGFFSFVEVYSRLESLKAEAPELDTVWLPDIQVMAVRSKKTTEVQEKSRFFLAAKAGNNYESHNHNDVGSFILFQGGHPV